MNNTSPAPIMIVEDDPYIMSSLIEVFQMMDREVLVAHNGRSGIETLSTLPVHKYPCCIILDLMMPEMNGEQFIYQIQALGKVELDSIPIIVSSASQKLEQLDSGRIRTKLKKPVDIHDLELIAETYK